MQNRLKHIWLHILILLIVIFGIRILYSSEWIENVYSTHWYIQWSQLQRSIAGLIPFSIGDLLYGAWAACIVAWIIMFFYRIFTRHFHWKAFFVKTSTILRSILKIYLVFILIWGLNYDRQGIAHQLQLKNGHYTTEELKNLTQTLLERVNDTRRSLGGFDYVYPSYEDVFEKTDDAYKEVAMQHSFLAYQQPCIKRSLYGRIGSYSGFTGYYNPFSGEAQVNVRVPAFYLPYVACHEVAHQLGYGDESEANFVGYLACKASKDTVFQYSVYFDLFNYANSELFYRDSILARENYSRLDTLVKKDIAIARAYNRLYRNPVAPLIQAFYSEYLKVHNQPHGIESYQEVTGWLIAYKKKYGTL